MWSNTRNTDSLFMDKVATDWLSEMTKEERIEFIDTLFTLVGEAGLESFRGLSWNMILKMPQFIKAYVKLPKEKKANFKRIIDGLFRIANKTLFTSGPGAGKDYDEVEDDGVLYIESDERVKEKI